MKDKKEKKEKSKFNLAFDNLAIPEVHIGGTAHGQGNVECKHPDADGEMEEEVVTFADVAIPEVHITRYKELSDMIHSLRKKLHENPEPSMQEEKTRHILQEFIKRHTTFEIVDKDVWFYAVKKAEKESGKAPIAFRADMDAVCGKDGKPGHYCGHDGHSSILCGVALYLSKREELPDRDVYLIFQPGEEIGAGAKICKELLAEKQIGEIYGLHNIPGYPKNQVLLRKGTFACASTGLSIRMTGTPSHAAYPEAGRNPAIPMAKLLLEIERITKEMQARGNFVRMTVIGADVGSANYGVSAFEGTLRLTVRAEKEDAFDTYVNEIKALAATLAEENQLTIAIEEIERFPATENHDTNVDKLFACAEKLQFPVTELAQPMRWSEDFGYYLQEVPGAFFGVGDGEDHAQLHTAEYEFPDEIMKTAVAMLVGLI
ncbi:M20 metallopeptidase family protein [Eubacterium sp. MSJ-33]|uniref:M20 metallopeptidase family protein n=1 Tax=Eubacterium sp. MSJ-33 TaxID=2841528 RepID=UPI001EE1C46D|nr:amidohydrolase [Eubacterium sp. MSJ-33]